MQTRTNSQLIRTFLGWCVVKVIGLPPRDWQNLYAPVPNCLVNWKPGFCSWCRLLPCLRATLIQCCVGPRLRRSMSGRSRSWIFSILYLLFLLSTLAMVSTYRGLQTRVLVRMAVLVPMSDRLACWKDYVRIFQIDFETRLSPVLIYVAFHLLQEAGCSSVDLKNPPLPYRSCKGNVSGFTI